MPPDHNLLYIAYDALFGYLFSFKLFKCAKYVFKRYYVGNIVVEVYLSFLHPCKHLLVCLALFYLGGELLELECPVVRCFRPVNVKVGLCGNAVAANLACIADELHSDVDYLQNANCIDYVVYAAGDDVSDLLFDIGLVAVEYILCAALFCGFELFIDDIESDQVLNANSLKARGLAHVMIQADMNAQSLPQAIDALWADRELLTQRLSALDDADGTQAVLEQIHRFAKK